MERLLIFDTTLRDGEQSPGFSMTPRQKLRTAGLLAELGVDIIEAGFPVSSDSDFDSVRQIASQIQGPTIAGLARCHATDIERAAQALEAADNARLHVFIATSPLHRQHKLRMSRDEVLTQAVAGVECARGWLSDIEFSAEDALRTEPEFLAEVITEVIAAGATTINIPDTVGYATPDEMGALIAYLRREVSNIDQAVISCHCHNDLGLAVANSLAAVQAGARQVECTISGIGERAGNCALEELVMALKTRQDQFPCASRIDTRRLVPASRLVAAVTGNFIPRNKAVVGENAFAHESGIHQHGMLAHRETYEIMRPEDVGLSRSELVLGKHSGRHAIGERCRELGYRLSDEELTDLCQRFKSLAAVKRRLFDADLTALIEGQAAHGGNPWQLVSLRADSSLGAGSPPAATLVLRDAQQRLVREAAVGDGPVDAICQALQRATGCELTLTALHMRNITEGEDAQGEAQIRAVHRQQEYRGHGISTDIVAACALALLDIINRICRQQRNPDHQAA
ncbi:MAG: 2-isopropylmalate synthase [Wenzhouxiangellaceae bacterium]